MLLLVTGDPALMEHARRDGEYVLWQVIDNTAFRKQVRNLNELKRSLGIDYLTGAAFEELGLSLYIPNPDGTPGKLVDLGETPEKYGLGNRSLIYIRKSNVTSAVPGDHPGVGFTSQCEPSPRYADSPAGGLADESDDLTERLARLKQEVSSTKCERCQWRELHPSPIMEFERLRLMNQQLRLKLARLQASRHEEELAMMAVKEGLRRGRDPQGLIGR
eukprot:Sspe_Gene.62374::Locus_34980_Transcript_1_1_Confidence_1.000_Length_942::g.62374::m.62374